MTVMVTRGAQQPGATRRSDTRILGRAAPARGAAIATFVLAGGEGRRLFPLTAATPKPAVPFGPDGRIIDFALENCLASGITSVAVLTQYRPVPLEVYLSRQFVPRFRGAGGALALVRTGSGPVPSYPGTADAIFAGLDALPSELDTILILAADHVYRMDYGEFIAAHARTGAALTIGAIEVPVAGAHRFGVIEADASGTITAFAEKPAHPTPVPHDPDRALVSMGIYVFRREALAATRDALDARVGIDFGRDVIPEVLGGGARACAFRHCRPLSDAQGVWFDVGTPEALLAANLELFPRGAVDPSARIAPSATLKRAIVRARSFVGSGAHVEDAFVLEDATIEPGARVRRAVIGPGVRIPKGATIEPAASDPDGVLLVAGSF